MPENLIPLNFLPGVQRDGTMLDSDTCIDAQWCRWRLGRPRKMGGFHRNYAALAGKPRRIHMFYQGDKVYVHVGTSASLQQIVLDRNGNLISSVDRTPSGFIGNANAGWTLDSLFDTTSEAVVLIAHSVPDITSIAGTTKTIPFSGIVTATTKLLPLQQPANLDGGLYTPPEVAGGIVAVQPYLFDYDSAGFVGWSPPNLPNSLGIKGGSGGAGSARVSAQKIVTGMPQRGGGVNSPAALFWSLSEIITCQFVGSANGIFAFNTVSPSSSILSGATVIEYDGLYLWAGIDRFLMYNGTVVEIPNKYNQDWFFDNMNWDAAGKAFAFKVPRYGEVWFCAPLFGAEECSHAAIWNIRENNWYDTELPNGGRSAGYFAQGFRYPIMGGVGRNADNKYSLWLHEHGTDQTGVSEAPQAVRSYFLTPYLGSIRGQQMDNKSTSFGELEADIVQTGNMTITPRGSFNARAGAASGAAVVLKAIPEPQEQIVSFKSTFRVGGLLFESNCLGGNYITGKSILHTKPGDEKITGGKGTPITTPMWMVSDQLQGLLTDAGSDVTGS